MGTRNVIMFIAIMVYVDMVLQTNSFKRVLEIRTLYLRLLLILDTCQTTPHYEDTSLAAERRFNLVVALAAVMWQLSFVLLLAYVYRYLTDVILPEIEREKSSTGWNSKAVDTNSWTASKNKKKLRGSGGKKFKSKSTAMASALRSGVITLRWLGFGVMVFILYSLFFTWPFLHWNSLPVYFFTLFINWSTPFVVWIYLNQIRDHQEQQQEDEEEARSPSDVALPYSLPSNNSNHSYPPPIQQIATLPTTNPIQAF
ncbi:hypothetical protein BC829DRAFT_385016 [Chytridium lagenaria]|nr:hypothetical protein BC829DRAFT_385016 [Chytridium lagenaria]